MLTDIQSGSFCGGAVRSVKVKVKGLLCRDLGVIVPDCRGDPSSGQSQGLF